MNPAEVEHLVKSLKPIPIEEVGSRQWKEQREAVERLNYVAHQNANKKADDFVMQFLLAHDKLVVLLHELIVCEIWRNRVMPQIVPALLENPTATYLYCYYESILVNLLECLMFFEPVVLGFGDDILELIDYAWRNVAYAFSLGPAVNQIPKEPAAAEGEGEDEKRFWNQIAILRGKVCMSAISLLWFIVDRLKVLPFAAMNNILVKNDLVIGMSEVLELQPWLRKDTGVRPPRVQKYKGGQFEDIKPEDQLVVVTVEAHAWFILHYLLCDRDARTKYQYTKSKKEIIMRIKKFLNETLIDQLPALVDVQRAVEELGFIEPPTGTEEKFKSTLLIEQVPRLISSIEGKGKNWKAMAENMQRVLTHPESRMEDARRCAALFDELYQVS
jgi:hypothetical protein